MNRRFHFISGLARSGSTLLSAILVDQAHGNYRLYRQPGTGHAEASPGGNTTAAALQAAWPLSAAQWQVTPAVGALYQRTR